MGYDFLKLTGAKRPGGETSGGRNRRWAKPPGGETSGGRNVRIPFQTNNIKILVKYELLCYFLTTLPNESRLGVSGETERSVLYYIFFRKKSLKKCGLRLFKIDGGETSGGRNRRGAKSPRILNLTNPVGTVNH